MKHFISAIFANFRRKMAFFLQTNVAIQFLYNWAVFWVNNATFFAENNFKIITLALYQAFTNQNLQTNVAIQFLYSLYNLAVF
jgi:hypothetical protein